ncbi:RNA polymerase II transcription factor B subunit 3 (TFB3) [Vairimorpha necatrix]|uniref:RNA polymerase II transcription factor B subunit 3 (TFB3) n=1 Tax=Vairimorpha necatrix TaxID=6039 RepID=A0AAX4J8T4_9MICR
MSDTGCPICKTDSYLNPEMVLFVSPCFHKMCESCLIRHFINGINKCPECGIELRKINYMSSTFEDIEVEKECRIRRQIDRYIKNEEEFKDPVEYNDYLEEIENLVFELVKYKSDSQIKKRISELAEVKEQVKEETALEEEEVFEVDMSISPLYKVQSDVIIPGDILVPSASGGLTKEIIISYLLTL